MLIETFSRGSYGLRLLGIAALLYLNACSSINPAVPPAPQSELQRPAASGEYKISGGDELDVRFFYTPELNATVVVRPDGGINLPMIGEVAAAGNSTQQLKQKLTQAYVDQLKRPDISVTVRGFASHRVFVGGEVLRAGVQPLIGPMSALQAIFMSEGFREGADSGEVVIIRRGEQGQRQIFKINLEQALSGADPSQDVLLQPFDAVLVPRSGIGNLNLWIDQYIRRNIPVGVGFTYTINKFDSAVR